MVRQTPTLQILGLDILDCGEAGCSRVSDTFPGDIHCEVGPQFSMVIRDGALHDKS